MRTENNMHENMLCSRKHIQTLLQDMHYISGRFGKEKELSDNICERAL